MKRISVYVITAATTLIFQCSLSFAGIIDYQYRQLQNKQQTMSYLNLFGTGAQQFNIKNTIQNTFDQVLDPSNQMDKRTFSQRYFINSDFAEGNNSPVIYVLCGEGACDDGGFRGAVVNHAAKLKAHLVALEHRYYGLSQPFNEMTTENLQYLKTEYALADLARFQDYITAQNHWTGSWIVSGGSYSGSLAAYYRLSYPTKVVGALASSAPVEAKANFEEYDKNTTIVAGPQCSAAIRGVVKQVEKSFNNPTRFAEIKHLFNADKVQSDVDFLYVIADMAAAAVQYGRSAEFCKAVLSSDPLTGYATAGKNVFAWLGITPLEDSLQGVKSTKASDYTKGVGARQWYWQTCTEYGYFQTAYSDAASAARSSLITLDYNYQMCSEIFGLNNVVNVEKINRTYYEPLLNSNFATNIFFTNGSTDPWRYLSILQERGNTVNPNLFYMTIDKGSHCSDLSNSQNISVIQAQNNFENFAKEWIR